MGVTVYFPGKTDAESEKLFIGNGKKIEVGTTQVIVKDASGHWVGVFTASNILGAVIDP